MKKILLALIMMAAILTQSAAQVMPLTLEPDGGNLKASISEQIGIVKITVNYSRPGVKGRKEKSGTPL